MTTQTLNEPGRLARAMTVLSNALVMTVAVLGPITKASARVGTAQLADHFYSICGLGLISAAAFVHSTFTGLLVTGLMFLAFEWKVSE